MNRHRRAHPPWKPWLSATLVTLAGGAIWLGLLLFEDLVTADLRWGLWATSALLFVLSVHFGHRGFAAWAPVLLVAPLLALYAVPLVLELPLFWPFVPLWAASALLGWWLTRRDGLGALAGTGLLAIGLLVFGAWWMPRALSSALNDYTDEPGPEIALQYLDGSPFPMEELAGKVVVLDFFATWCVPCRAELPELQEVRRQLADRDDIVFLVVGDGDSGDSIEQVAAFAESSDLVLPFVWDEGGRAHDAFGFWNIPALAVIDRNGRVRLKRVGYNAAETRFGDDLRELLLAL